MAAIGRFLVTAFFAVVFGQSALDKLFDVEGNVSYFQDHFKSSPFPPELIRPLFWLLTAIEATAGALCSLGLISRGGGVFCGGVDRDRIVLTTPSIGTKAVGTDLSARRR